MPTQRKCRSDSSRHSPNADQHHAAADRDQRGPVTDRVAVTRRAATIATEARWPAAIGGSARSSDRAGVRSCSPRATANSQPIAGFRPWKAPSAASAASVAAGHG